MVQIAICDDNKEDLQKIHESLEKAIFEKGGIQAEIADYTTSVSLNETLDQGKIPDLLFLDICMEKISGITLAKKIREKKPGAKIVFITSSKDYAVEAFALNACHYLLKPFSKKDLAQALDRALDSFKAQPKKIAVYGSKSLIQTIDLEQIIYIESVGYKRYVHIPGMQLTETRRTLTAFLEELEKLSPGQFIIPYRGYIINLKAVRTISPKNIEMQDGSKILIKTGTYTKIKDIYFNYMFIWGGV